MIHIGRKQYDDDYIWQDIRRYMDIVPGPVSVSGYAKWSFGYPLGGRQARDLAKRIDEWGFKRRKVGRPVASNGNLQTVKASSHEANAAMKDLTFAPAIIMIDPQGVTEFAS